MSLAIRNLILKQSTAAGIYCVHTTENEIFLTFGPK